MQAPIGPAATPELVLAVCRAGGLGSLGASWTPVRVLREQIAAIRREHDGPFAVNLVLDFDQAERLELLIEERVPAISFSWGVDPDAIRRAREAGATVLVQVGDAGAAREAAQAGADVLIAQGIEAGGHVQSRTPLQRLLGELRAAVSVPLLAAGGIASAASVAAARAAGASGVVAGTAYLAADEADVHAAYREELVAATADDTVLTTLFAVGWPHAPHRVLRNSTYRAWEAQGCPPGVSHSDEQPTNRAAGDAEAMALYAGMGVGEVRAFEPAAQITQRLLAYSSYG
jgi:nitronate monooxygenase